MEEDCEKSSCSSPCLDSDFSSRIFYSELIMTIIFQHLSVPDLARCSLVCQTWNRVARRVKKKRTQLFWMYKVFPCKNKRYDEHLVSYTLKQVVAREESDVGKHYFEVLRSAPSEPVSGFIFGSSKLLFETESFFNFSSQKTEMKERKLRRRDCRYNGAGEFTSRAKDTAYFLSHSLPKPNDIILCFASGIVGTSPDNSVSVEAEISVGLSGVFIPKISGVHMHQFIMTLDDRSSAKITKKKNEIASSIPDSEDIKCLIFLVADELKNYQDEVIKHLLQRTNYQLAFGGAQVDALGSCNGAADQPFITGVGLVFYGDNVSAASLVLSDAQTSQEAEKHMQKLKSANFSEESAYCFMFACCGRGVHQYKEENVEARAFRKVFPKVPLFGIFGNGEFGLDYIPGSMQSISKVTSKQPDWEHSYTTVFVLISLGK